MFTKRKSIKQVEEGTKLAPKFDKLGLIPVITTHYKNGDVLMQGYMNKEALKKSIETLMGATSHIYKVIVESSL